MEKIRSAILPIMLFLTGLSVLLYPTVSNYRSTQVQSTVIASYEAALNAMERADSAPYFTAADRYNAQLRQIGTPLVNCGQIPGYDALLNIDGTGMIGYVSIDKINAVLPIYHGTAPGILNVAAGHIEGTSLPVGGNGTHAVLSAHCGLPRARLFTDLDQLQEGDRFSLTVLDRILTYEVDRISVVKPDQTAALAIEDGKDYCTLMTCTPYGINTHRLLVRGVRTKASSPQGL